MDIATFRISTLRMLEKIEPEQATEASRRIQLTLDLLGTETMSIETVATIIALCTK